MPPDADAAPPDSGGARLSTEAGLTVGGVLLWGVANYAVYAVGSRLLAPEEFATYALWWTAMNVLSVGLFAPFESSGPHLLAANRIRRGSDNHAARWLVKAACVSWAVAVGLLLVGTTTVPSNETTSWWALAPWGALNLAAAAIASVQRSFAIGRRDYRSLFAQLATTGVVQVIALGALLAVGADHVTYLAAVTGVAPFVGVAVAASRGVTPGRNDLHMDVAERRAARRSLYSMSVSALASQVMHNATLPTANRGGLGAYQVAGYVGVLTLGRVPLMLLNPIGAPLIPRMTAAVTLGDRRGFVRILAVMYLGCTGLAGLGVVLAASLGQAVLTIYLGPGYSVPTLIMVSVAVSAALFLLTSFLRFALISLDRPGASAISWLVALVVLFAVLLSPLSVWWKLGLATPTALAVLLVLLSLSVWKAMGERFKLDRVT